MKESEIIYKIQDLNKILNLEEEVEKEEKIV